MGLKEYTAKRNFRSTREPTGKTERMDLAQDGFFVVQKHDATRLHYDFRLAMAGVLKSWAVPKGFPTRKGDRRLAVQVEDHPLDYARFEGIIPEGNYGAGTVMVWDLGAYEVAGDNPVRALENGKLHLVLHGKKLKGEWTLVRMRRAEEDKPQWLLLKSGGDLRPFSERAEDSSALTGRSLQRIALDNDAQWQSNRIAVRARTPPLVRKPQAPRAGPSRHPFRHLPPRSPGFVEPMKAMLVDRLPKGSEWAYEVKFDGIRALAIKEGSRVELLSRNEKVLTEKYPKVAEALQALTIKEAILDGEITALDPEGRPSFQLLQSRDLPGAKAPIFYYVFDILQIDGKDVTGLTLPDRKALLQSLVSGLPEVIRPSGIIQAPPERVLREMKARGLEGLIAKRKDSTYEIGRRSGAWVKFKWSNEQEFVIGGYTPPKGSRSHFGALLVGYYEGSDLMFASKVGTGFNQKLLASLHRRFQPLIRKSCPFANLPEKPGSGGIGPAEMRRCTWIEPELVCQIRFAEWTRDRHLRQPAFLGLREDKDARQVVRENAA